MITEKKLLSDCGDCLVIDDGTDSYKIQIVPNQFLILQVGGCINKPVAKFSHPNVILSRKEVFEFKHYRHSGSKFWTSHAGISHYFIIPTNKIYILPEKGYSWIPAEINGVKVHFNVSGGGGGLGGWTDYLGGFTAISINHKLRDVKKIAEVAVREDELIKTLLTRLDEKDKDPIYNRPNELARWAKMAEKASPNVKKSKEKLLQMIEGKGLDVVIVLNDGYMEKIGNGIEVMRSGQKEMLTETSWRYDYSKGRVKSLIVHFDGSYLKRVKDSQINWVKTVEANANLLYERHAIAVEAMAV